MLEKKHSENLNKKPLKRSERLRKRRKLLFVSAFLFSLIIALYGFALQSDTTRYVTVTVVGDGLIEKVKKVTETSLHEKSYLYFPNDSLFSPWKDSVRQNILLSVPEIDTLLIKRDLFHREYIVTYTLRKPVFKNDAGMYLDEHNTWYSDERVVTLPTLSSEKPVKAEDLRKLIFLKETIESALFPISTVHIDALSDVEFTLLTSSLTQITFSLKQDEKEVWSKLVSALDTTPLKEDKEAFAKVRKLDIRFGNKIYYTMNIDKGVTTPTSTATTTYERQ